MTRFNSDEIRAFVSPAGSRSSAAAAALDTPLPRLSIVTPSFNQAPYLERTILSVLNQQYSNLEYVVIDGGSTDGSVEIIRKYAAQLAYWVSEPDTGQSDALNKGFARVTGDIVGWQNSDDLYLPGAFHKAVTALAAHPDVDVVFSNRLDVDVDDRVIGETRFTPMSLVGYWYEGMALSNQSTFWRRRLFDAIGLVDVGLHCAMDYEFFLRAALKGAKFRHVRDVWGAIRRHEASKQNTLFTQHMQRECELIDARYGKNRTLARLFRQYAHVRRTAYYLLQGDADYVKHGLLRRLGLNSTR